jgi:membrane-associated protease RseP (regulator of RpoE activity)
MPVHDAANVISLGDSLLFKGLSRAILGAVPDNQDIYLHPVALAGWIGFFVTSLNLIPVGQLDGGHALYVLIGKRARLAQPIVLLILVGLGFFYTGWFLWAALIYFVVGRAHAEPLDQITEVDGPRKVLAILTLILFVLVITPIPLTSAF